MDIKFEGKRALVTGVGRGIGRGVAKALWAAGAQVVGIDRTQAHLDSLRAECPGLQTVFLDISDWDKTRTTVDSLGEFDLLVNNAAVVKLAPLLETTREHFETTFDINLKAVFNITQVVAQKMIAREGGAKGCAIVNVSSQTSATAFQDHAIYGVSKAGLDHLTHCFASELGPHQIRTNSINPTVVLTELGRSIWCIPGAEEKAEATLSRIPLHRFAEVHDVVHAIMYLLSDKADMINGANLPVDGGAWCT